VASSGEAVGTDLELSSEVNRDQIAANNIYRSSPAVNSGCEQVVSQTRTEIDRLKDDKDWVPARAFVADMAAAVGVKIVSRHVLGGLECQARSHRVNVAAVGYSVGDPGGSRHQRTLRRNPSDLVVLFEVHESDARLEPDSRR
jgi:hypothetical protein